MRRWKVCPGTVWVYPAVRRAAARAQTRNEVRAELAL
jgi:hypothetical protein